jgi:dTDP-4-dehydrorhamnose reductase
MNHIIIFGSNGMLGRYLYKYFNDLNNFRVIPITRKDFEINEKNMLTLLNFLKGISDQEQDNKVTVINCTGLIPQRQNLSKQDFLLVNTVFPLALEKVCTQLKYNFIHASTDCVFNGSKGKYSENDIPDANSIYGISKTLGEPLNSTVIRTSIIGEELDNKLSFLEWVKNSKGEINGYNNHYWNGITCLQYCHLVEAIISKKLFWKGIKHIYSSDIVSKYELCCIIADVYNLNNVLKINRTSAPCQIDKTLVSIYDFSSNIFSIPSILEQIREQSFFSLK